MLNRLFPFRNRLGLASDGVLMTSSKLRLCLTLDTETSPQLFKRNIVTLVVSLTRAQLIVFELFRLIQCDALYMFLEKEEFKIYCLFFNNNGFEKSLAS